MYNGLTGGGQASGITASSESKSKSKSKSVVKVCALGAQGVTPADLEITRGVRRDMFPKEFVWGSATAAYQVQGGPQTVRYNDLDIDITEFVIMSRTTRLGFVPPRREFEFTVATDLLLIYH